MNRVSHTLAVVIVALAAVALAAPAPSAIKAQLKPKIYLNTLEDLPAHPDHCLPGNPCPIRGAIEKAESVSGGAIITACLDPDVVPDAKRCPGGKVPLMKDDEDFDESTGQWSIKLTPGGLPLQLDKGGTEIDFSVMIDPYDSFSDNPVVFDGSGTGLQYAFQVESNDNILRAFDIVGGYSEAAIVLQDNVAGDGASNNFIGPGVVFRDITEGNGVKIRGRSSVNNKISGTWCGVGGDGTDVRPISADCVSLSGGTHGNLVGGETPEDRNVFASSELGVGVKLEDPGTSGNTIRGNWFGIDAIGEPTSGVFAGILAIAGASGNQIIENVIAKSRSEGISIGGDTNGMLIENNTIGVGPDGETCFGNDTYGITLQFGPKSTRIIKNHIACNKRGGIVLTGAGTSQNLMSQNEITKNSGNAIDLTQRANNRIDPPDITGLDHTSVSGRACLGCVVEAFTDPVGEAAHFEGSVTADAGDGKFVLSVPGGFEFRTLTLTQTDGMNTSALTNYRTVPGAGTSRPPTATTTPPVGPSPTGGLFVGRIFMPWSADNAWFSRSD